MNDFKSQGQTLEEARANLDEGIFIEDSFFREHLEIIRKQRPVGLALDMNKAKAVLAEVDYSDIPGPIRNRTLILDTDQLLACRPDLDVSGDDAATEKVLAEVREIVRQNDIKVVTSPTGRRIPARLIMEWQMPGKMRPTNNDTEFTFHLNGDFSKLEHMCLQDVPDPKNPLIFKITELVDDPEELPRLRKNLEFSQETKIDLGWPMPPIFVESVPEANAILQGFDDTMVSLMKLAQEFEVDIYFGTRPALKTVMYPLMYGARKGDLDLSGVEEITVQKSQEILDKQLKFAILGTGRALERDLMQVLSDHHDKVVGEGYFGINEFAAITKAEKPVRDWEHTKLRRGKGHNKFKRKGKK